MPGYKNRSDAYLRLYTMLLTVILMVVSVFWACSPQSKQQGKYGKHLFEGQFAPLLAGLGDFHYKISTDDSLAQAFFNQGLILAYGFNHKEANRSFRQAAALDSVNPMPWWGAALVLGPNINAPMPQENISRAWQALQKAQQLKANGTQKEQDLIEALSYRYSQNPPDDRTPLDKEYAEAMGKAAKRYPDDPDIQTLYAEALIDLHPWDYWKKNGEPRPWTPEILNVLELVMQQVPNHPGANHFYIHALEASQTPERALTSANRLRKLVPGAGHLVHMPSHIYIRTGDYHEGTLANQRAIKSDNAYVTQCRQQGIYTVAYLPHNHHFLWATATFEGRRELSIKAAMMTSAMIDTAMMRQPGLGTLQHYWVIPLYAYIRFGEWNEIFSYPKPAEDLIYPLGVWHFARGLAYTAQDEYSKAQMELDKLKTIAANDTLKEITIWDINTTKELMEIANRVLGGELAAKQGRYSIAIQLLKEAVAIEDQLNYNEPADWFFPVRQNLGAVLLEAGHPEQAEKVYRNDLKKYPQNGWSLYGLYQSLIAQDKTEEAANVKQQFKKAWRYADTELNASRMM